MNKPGMQVLVIATLVSLSVITFAQNTTIKAEKNAFKNRKSSSQQPLNMPPPVNDYIGNATLIDKCGVAFTTNNTGATADYSPTQPCCGEVDAIGSYCNNLDCNNSTDPQGTGFGTEACYSVESDIWYKFCPQTTGTWTISINPTNCKSIDPSAKGFQYSVYQGSASNLATQFSCNSGNLVSGGYTNAQNSDISITNPSAGCVFIQIDGYAGDECDFGVSLQAPSGLCNFVVSEDRPAILEVSRLNRGAVVHFKLVSKNAISRYMLERSIDGLSYTSIALFDAPYADQPTEMNILHSDKFAPATQCYYRLTSIDMNGAQKILKTAQLPALSSASARVWYNRDEQKLNLASDKVVKASIYDFSGRCIYVQDGEGLQDINTASLPVGEYLLRVSGSSGEVLNTTKFIK